MWYEIIVQLANNDVTRIDKVTNLKTLDVLNYLTYLKYKALKERNRYDRVAE